MHHQPKTKHRAHGTAMSEMVLVLPVILIMLALMVFYGRGMIRNQRVKVMDRYEVWRQVHEGSGARVDSTVNHATLNQLFFNNHAENIEADAVPDNISQVGNLLVNDAYLWSAETGNFAAMVFAALDRSRQYRFTVDHDESLAIMERFNFSQRSMHLRIEHDWPFIQQSTNAAGQLTGSGQYTSILTMMRAYFLNDFSTALNQANDNTDGNVMFNTIYQSSVALPGYHGPTVE